MSRLEFCGGGTLDMAHDVAKLDGIQRKYKEAVEEWIKAIREEEALASVGHSEAKIDSWEAAGFREEDARKAAKEAKAEYEDALREELFNF
jgi:hypothetical protein